MLKKYYFLVAFVVEVTGIAKSETGNDEIIGKWKFIKMEVAGKVAFDLDDLLNSYRQFSSKQKKEVYKGSVSEKDSLAIQRQFEKTVNDINRMFVEFKQDKHYVTNSYNSAGGMTDKTETGTYEYVPAQKLIKTYIKGDRKKRVTLTLISVSKNELVIRYAGGPDAPVFTCRKVVSPALLNTAEAPPPLLILLRLLHFV